METIKVNMSPNPLDVQTIHASQNDTEARDWGFELHNNGDVIDSSEITDQMVFKAYEGGTEQLLPENGSTPTTSPFLGDIRYPQGLLTDQEFTYRQSPTEEDGLAKITDIKGNTLVWNQQLNDTGRTTTTNGITFTKNADGSFTLNGTATAQADYDFERFDYISGHKYLVNGIPNGATVDGYRAFLFGSNITANRIINATRDDWFTPRIRVSSGVTVSNVVFRLNIFDLSKMFDSGNEPTIEEFTSLFPLSYYSYNQGSLLSFNGNGIKTVGKNQSQLVSMSTINGGYINASSGDIATVKKGITYTLSFDNLTTSTSNVVARILVDETWKQQGFRNLVANSRWSLTFTATDDGAIGLSAGLGSQYSQVKVFDNIQLEFGSTNTEYEPYTETTTDLPISTYFPTGMKSAGTVYDELTESKAISRIGAVDLGSLEWSYNSTYGMYSIGISNSVKKPSASSVRANAISTVGTFTDWATFYASGTSSGLWAINTSGYIGIATTETNSTTFKNSLQGVYLFYELATPTETSFTTASLVTENAEIPLSNDDGVLIGKCTEELSENPGFIDAKIKLSDGDGECYSNKIQLHVERSPQ